MVCSSRLPYMTNKDLVPTTCQVAPCDWTSVRSLAPSIAPADHSQHRDHDPAGILGLHPSLTRLPMRHQSDDNRRGRPDYCRCHSPMRRMEPQRVVERWQWERTNIAIEEATQSSVTMNRERYMRVTLLIIIALFFGCTDEEASRRALEGAGYTNIQFNGRSWGGCSQDDATCTKFSATGPRGALVTGAVGCGGGSGCGQKGCTIRTF